MLCWWRSLWSASNSAQAELRVGVAAVKITPAQRNADGGLLLRPRQRGCPRRPLCQSRGAGRWQHEGGPGGLRPHHPAPQDRAGRPAAHRAANRHSRRPRDDLGHAHAYRAVPVAGLRARQAGRRQQRPVPKIHAGVAQPDRPGRGRGERQAHRRAGLLCERARGPALLLPAVLDEGRHRRLEPGQAEPECHSPGQSHRPGSRRRLLRNDR